MSSWLFHNNGDGTFTDVSQKMGLADNPGKSWGVVATDINNDGWMDVVLSTLGGPPVLLLNRGGVGEVDAAEAARLGFAPERTRIVRIDSPPISATEVRRRAAAGLGTEDLVPAAVARLIEERGLYRAVAGSRPPWDNPAG